MVPQQAQSDHTVVCTHGPRGVDRALGICIPCRDAVLYCAGCQKVIDETSYLRYDRRCEDCFDELQRTLDIAADFRYFQGLAAGSQIVRGELRAQDRGGA